MGFHRVVNLSGDHQEQTTNFRNYTTFLTPESSAASSYWNWAYTQMILRANTIIEYAEKPESASPFCTA